MIRVTRLDRQEIVLNCDLIECIEARPDSTIRLITGASLVVREDVTELLERVRLWRASVLARAGLPALLAQTHTPVLLPRVDDERESELEFESDRAALEIPA